MWAGGITFKKGNSGSAHFHIETHGYFDTSQSTGNLNYLLRILKDIGKLGAMNDGDFDKEWFFEPTGFKLDIADDPKHLFAFDGSRYSARMETINYSYSPIDFGQFILGMRPGVLMALSNLAPRATTVDWHTRLTSENKHRKLNLQSSYKMILADGVYEVDRSEIERLTDALVKLEQAGYHKDRNSKKSWSLCILGEYVWFSTDLISFIKNMYLRYPRELARNEWAKFLLIESVVDGKIVYVPLDKHSDKNHEKMLFNMERQIKKTLTDSIHSKMKQRAAEN